MNLFGRLKWLRGKIKKAPASKKIAESTNSSSRSPSEATTSLSQIQTSSVYRKGRRYQAYRDCAYILPNDDAEIDRLHLQHWLMKNVLGRNYSSPVEADLEKGIKVLDVGCGGGTWVLEMANTYSNSNFTGIDVSATWPTEIRPRNTDFVVGNVIHELPFEDNAFDFVYMRFLGMGVPNYQYPIVLASLFRVLKPGGWIELVEIDGAQQYKGEKTCQFYNALLQYLASRGFKDGMVTNLDQKVLDAGFVNIDGTRIRIPLGSWGGKLGVVFQEDVNNAYVSLRPIIQPILKFSDEEFEAMLIRVQEENNEEKQEANWFSFWAQKPIN